MDAIPESILQDHLQMQILIDGYQDLHRQNAILIEQMLAMGYKLPHGFSIHPETGRMAVVVEQPEVRDLHALSFMLRG